jgi:hypothetical protein|nr:MAG TPA: hypothetical protein [Podoviridae sp. ctY3D12]
MKELKNYNPKTEEEVLLSIMLDSCVITDHEEAIMEVEEIHPFEMSMV